MANVIAHFAQKVLQHWLGVMSWKKIEPNWEKKMEIGMQISRSAWMPVQLKVALNVFALNLAPTSLKIAIFPHDYTASPIFIFEEFFFDEIDDFRRFIDLNSLEKILHSRNQNEESLL